LKEDILFDSLWFFQYQYLYFMVCIMKAKGLNLSIQSWSPWLRGHCHQTENKDLRLWIQSQAMVAIFLTPDCKKYQQGTFSQGKGNLYWPYVYVGTLINVLIAHQHRISLYCKSFGIVKISKRKKVGGEAHNCFVSSSLKLNFRDVYQKI